MLSRDLFNVKGDKINASRDIYNVKRDKLNLLVLIK
jgi:hypothetical protein